MLNLESFTLHNGPVAMTWTVAHPHFWHEWLQAIKHPRQDFKGLWLETVKEGE